jgi:hypothetical protein
MNCSCFHEWRILCKDRSVKIYEIVKIFSIKIPVQKLDGVLKSVLALVCDDSIGTFTHTHTHNKK